MYFRDESCQSNISLKKSDNLNIFKYLEADWTGIIVLTKKRKVIVEKGYFDFSGINLNMITETLKNNFDKIINNKKLLIEDNGYYYTYLIRNDIDYWVITAIYKNTPFDKKDIRWYEIYLKIAYEKVLLENEFAQKHNVYKNIFDSNVVGICNFDLEGKVVASNDMSQEMFGFPIGEEPDWNVKNIQAINENWNTIFDLVVFKRKRFSIQRVAFTTKENSFFYNYIFAPIVSNKDQVLGVVMLCTNITETILLEEENHQLERFALLGEIATGVAHDVRNPLMNIQSVANFVRKYEVSNEEKIESLDLIINEVDRINKVIEQLLSYVDINKKKTDVYLNINEIISKTISVAKRNRSSKHIHFFTDFDENIPLMKGNPTGIHQALLNVVLNSMQAIANEGDIKITSSFSKERQEICVEIYDNGQGISYYGQKNLFKPFFSTKANGVGFGLSIVKRAVEEHGGYINFNSSPGFGTTFYIVLPIILNEDI